MKYIKNTYKNMIYKYFLKIEYKLVYFNCLSFLRNKRVY